MTNYEPGALYNMIGPSMVATDINGFVTNPAETEHDVAMFFEGFPVFPGLQNSSGETSYLLQGYTKDRT